MLRPEQSPDAAEIIAWVRKRLAHYKCPKTVDFVPSLPRNPTGKLLKRVLRQPYWGGAAAGGELKRRTAATNWRKTQRPARGKLQALQPKKTCDDDPAR